MVRPPRQAPSTKLGTSQGKQAHHKDKCLQHTNQKNAREREPTAFFPDKKPLPAEGLLKIGAEKGVFAYRPVSLNMLPKSRRIPRELFRPLLESGKYFNTKHFVMRVAPSSDIRMAVSVSKKVSKKAVVRNKIRRRVYSVLNKIFSDIKPCLYMFIAKPNSSVIKGGELEDELKTLIRSINN